jgi:signal transduction histidine kinase
MTGARRLVCSVGLVLVVPVVLAVGGSPGTTYGGADLRLLAAETAAAVALLLVGAWDSLAGRGLALALLGLLWLLPELAGWVAAPALLRTTGSATAPLVVAVTALVLALSTSPRRERTRVVTVVVVTVVVVTAGVGAAVARLLLVDPFLDPRCWRTCDTNPLSRPDLAAAGRWIGWAGLAVTVAAALWVATPRPARWADRFAPSQGAKRQVGGHRARAVTAVTAGAAAVVVGALAAAETLRSWLPEKATSPPFVVLFMLAQGAALVLAGVIGVERYREWRLLVRLTGLAEGLRSASASGTLAAALGRAIGDPRLRVDYWVPTRQQFVDVDGCPAGTVASGAVTPVARRGELLARLVHSTDIDGDRIDRGFGAALRLALENEQLRAATLAELHELQSSRVRIVDRSADERRRLERNLHDGAQQRVVALSLVTHMLRARVLDPRDVELTERAEALTRATLEELRRVARGIYPAVLADSGLRGAVLDLAQSSSDVAVVVEQLPACRFPGRVETTAFLVISGALADARARAATELVVSASGVDGALRVELRDDAPRPQVGPPEDLADQVGALSGELAVGAGAEGARVSLVLPCGW